MMQMQLPPILNFVTKIDVNNSRFFISDKILIFTHYVN